MENWELYLYDWVDVGDSKVCPTCRHRATMAPMLFSEWEATPGDGQSECGGKCRCIFLPHEIVALDTSFEGGKTILLELEKQVKRFPTSIQFEEAVFKQVDELVGQYESLTSVYYEVGDWNLPEKFYRLHGGDEKRAFLRELLKMVKSGKFPESLKKDILSTNDWWMQGKFPSRKLNKLDLLETFKGLLEAKKKELKKLPKWKTFDHENFSKGMPAKDIGKDIKFYPQKGKEGYYTYVQQFLRTDSGEVWQKTVGPVHYKKIGTVKYRHQDVRWERVDAEYWEKQYFKSRGK